MNPEDIRAMFDAVQAEIMSPESFMSFMKIPIPPEFNGYSPFTSMFDYSPPSYREPSFRCPSPTDTKQKPKPKWFPFEPTIRVRADYVNQRTVFDCHWIDDWGDAIAFDFSMDWAAIDRAIIPGLVVKVVVRRGLNSLEQWMEKARLT